MADRVERGELVQGTLDMLVLKTLASGPMHGYAIARRIQQSSGELLKVEEGSLYPALHRMERRGWIVQWCVGSETQGQVRSPHVGRPKAEVNRGAVSLSRWPVLHPVGGGLMSALRSWPPTGSSAHC